MNGSLVRSDKFFKSFWLSTEKDGNNVRLHVPLHDQNDQKINRLKYSEGTC